MECSLTQIKEKEAWMMESCLIFPRYKHRPIEENAIMQRVKGGKM